MIIGKFQANSDEHMFWGEVSFIDYPVHILPVLRPKTGGPDYYVIGKSLHGAMDYGAGWWRKDGKSGERYLAIILDSPAWRSRITARLQSDRNAEHTFSLSWQRPRPSRAARPATSA
jgi:uncharacterized protein (DUF736 family)